MNATRPSPRIFLLLAAGSCLILGLNAALIRLGTWAPISRIDGETHGLVMTLGFLGGVISLERAQALASKNRQRIWAYFAPICFALGGLLHVFSPRSSALQNIGHFLFIEAAIILVLIYFLLWKRAPQPLLAAQILSGISALAAALLALVFPLFSYLPFLLAFIVITIISERTELAQITLGKKAEKILLASSSALIICAAIGLINLGLGQRFFGAALIFISLWLIRDDVPRRLIHSRALPRFMSYALLFGYIWLLVAGLIFLLRGEIAGTVYYDAVVHSIFLGFGMSMIFAHAPVIFPTVTALAIPYHPFMYLPLVLLHFGLLARVASGIFLGQGPAWSHSAILTVFAILLFLITVVAVAVRARIAKKAIKSASSAEEKPITHSLRETNNAQPKRN